MAARQHLQEHPQTSEAEEPTQRRHEDRISSNNRGARLRLIFCTRWACVDANSKRERSFLSGAANAAIEEEVVGHLGQNINGRIAVDPLFVMRVDTFTYHPREGLPS